MIKPSVRLIEGHHVTASDKRSIIDCLYFLRDQDPADWCQWLSRKGSRKSYLLTPDPAASDQYGVAIKERYRNDYGKDCDRMFYVVVSVAGIDTAQADLFATAL